MNLTDNKRIKIKGEYSIEGSPNGDYEFIWDWLIDNILHRLEALSPCIYVITIKVGIKYKVKDSDGTISIDLVAPKNIPAKKIMHQLEDIYNYEDNVSALLGCAEAFIEWRDIENA